MEALRRAPLGWCLLSAVLFGATPPAAKLLLAGSDPFQLAGLLYLGAAVAVLPFARGSGSRERRRQGRHRLQLAGSILAGGVAGPVLLLFALRLSRAASISLWLNLEPVATALLAALFFREHLGRRTALAAAAVVGGGVLLAIPAGFAGAAPAALVALACLAWALDNNLTALIDGLTPTQLTLVKGAAAGAINLALAAATGARVWPSAGVVAAALAVGGLGYGASIALYVAGAQALGAARAQLAFSAAPVAGLAVAWIALGEPVLPVQLAAAALIAAGVVLLARGRHAHQHAHEPVTHSHSHRHNDGHHDHAHPGLLPSTRHTHEHAHGAIVHSHDHVPDLHHRHRHGGH